MKKCYVYILFDWLGIPRYVGKGVGSRWEIHERKTDKHNSAKNEFIERTWNILGEIPKIKVRENISNSEACTIEEVFISVLGRLDLNTGPLTNLTAGGDGMSVETWSTISEEERRNRTRNAVRTAQIGFSKEELSLRARNAALVLNAKQSPEEKIERCRKGGLARGLKLTIEQKREIGRLAGAASNRVLTHEQRVENGKLGAFSFKSILPERRSEISRNTLMRLTPEERLERASLAGKSAWASFTPEERSEILRARWIKRRATKMSIVRLSDE